MRKSDETDERKNICFYFSIDYIKRCECIT